MARRLGLIACASFEQELLALRSAPEFQDVRFIPFSTRCHQAEASWPGLADAVASCRGDGCAVALAGGYCLTRPIKEIGLDGSCRLLQKAQCFEWVADKGVVDGLLQGRALLVVPGWLADWEAHVEARWPGDRKAAQAYFREVSGRVVLLDTGVRPGLDCELKAFSRFVRLPGEIHPTGLDHVFRMSLARSVLSWRLENEKTDSEARMSAAWRQVSDFSRVGQLLGVATKAKSVEDAQAGVLELFRVILSPREVIFRSVESLAGRPVPESSPIDRIIALNADYAWADDGKTVFLKVAHDRELQGVVEIGGFGGPERADQDLDLALGLARISGLALLSVRVTQALGAERDRASRSS